MILPVRVDDKIGKIGCDAVCHHQSNCFDFKNHCFYFWKLNGAFETGKLVDSNQHESFQYCNILHKHLKELRM